jgi:hypothetical protein
LKCESKNLVLGIELHPEALIALFHIITKDYRQGNPPGHTSQETPRS